MREPSLAIDGWCLENGESLHEAAPSTFWIPDRKRRNSLKPGDFAKLVFRIAVDNEQEPEAVERMWVLVRERVGKNYIGLLDNEPSSIAENGDFWLRSEVPFGSHHVIDFQEADSKSIAGSKTEPLTRWPR